MADDPKEWTSVTTMDNGWTKVTTPGGPFDRHGHRLDAAKVAAMHVKATDAYQRAIDAAVDGDTLSMLYALDDWAANVTYGPETHYYPAGKVPDQIRADAVVH
jgi:hypothetical protein